MCFDARFLAQRLALTLVLGSLVGAAGHAQEDVGDLAALSLDELLSRQLSSMSITGIQHTHDAGEWMIGVSGMYMRMDGNRDGTSRISDGSVLRDFMVTPTSMNMSMLMLHAMYAPTDEVTLMLMVPYVRKDMDHKTRMGQRFTTRSDGLGDVELTGLYGLYRSETHRVVAELGLSLPTGSIDEKDDIPASMGRDVRLPYPMQLGSGTWDLAPGLTYLGQTPDWSWGAHASGVIHTGWNGNDYRLGDSYHVTGWGARRLADWLSASLRLDFAGWGDIHGADPRLNPRVVPTADPDLRAGRSLSVLLGVNVFQIDGALGGNRLALEVGTPVYQWLDGPQLETDWSLSLSWDWTF